jgi:glutathione S-transferase
MKLTYFNGRGLAETSRVLLAVAGQEYEDFRYPLNIIDWSVFNMTRVEFDNDKKAGKFWRSMDKLPSLEVDGEVIFQSKSIERYLAHRFNLLGSTPLEAAFIDSICETIRDFKDGYQKVRSAPAEAKESAAQIYFSETLPPALCALDYIIKSRQSPDTTSEETFVVGKKISLADIVIFLFLTDFFDNKQLARNAYENCDVLKKIITNVGNLDTVKNWLLNRPETPF